MNTEWMAGLEDYADDDLAAALDIPPPPPAPTTEDVPFFAPGIYDEPEEDNYAYQYSPQTVPPWTPALVFDVALGLETEETLFDRHGLTTDAWAHINTHPLFLRQVADQAREMGESGLTFRTKARIQAEMYLEDIDRMVASPNTDQKVKLEAIRSMVKWGNLEPVPSKEDGVGVAQVNVQIIMWPLDGGCP